MQRLYPVLLSSSIALAIAIFLRPQLAEDLAGLAGSAWNSLGSAAHAANDSEAARASDAGATPGADRQPPADTQLTPWPAAAANAMVGPAGQSAVSDVPVYPSTRTPFAPAWPNAAVPAVPQPTTTPVWPQGPVAVPQPTTTPAWPQGPVAVPPPLEPRWNVPPSGGAAGWSEQGNGPSPVAPAWSTSGVPGRTEGPPSRPAEPAAPQIRQEGAFGPNPWPAVPPSEQREEDTARTPAGYDLRPPADSRLWHDAAAMPAGPPASQSLQRPQAAIAGQMPPEAQIFERGQIVGRVGSEVILFGEIGLGIPEIRDQYKDRFSPDELEKQIGILLRERLKPQIETKLVYLDVRRNVPADALKNLEKRVAEEFENSQVPQIIKNMKVGSRQEAEDKLRAWSSSLDQQKRAFVQQMIARQWLKQQVKVEEEVTYDQMLTYYREHVPDYEQPAQTRWQQLTVRFSRVPDKAEAYRTLAELGNQVLGGRDFAEVAKASSDGPTARNGGLRDWTIQGSLVSQTLDQAVFTLPVGELSPILEDEQGFHIVRVLERQDAHRTPFRDAQVEIRKKVREQREQEQQQAYLAKLWEKTPVWTMFDGPADGLRVSGRAQVSASDDSQTSKAGWPR